MEIFKLFGSIFVDNDKANKSIHKTDEEASKLSTKFVSGVKTVGKWGAAIGGACVAVGGAMLGVANASAGAMDEIDKMSNKIGISKQSFQEWKYVLGQNGMAIDKMQVGVKTLVGKMSQVQEGNKNATESFSQLGLSIYDSSGALKSQEQMMNEALYALADMQNGTEKARLATELFGKAGVEMMPMLNNGSQGMKDLTQRAHDLGLVVSDEAVTAGVVFGDTMDDLKQSLGMISTHLGNAFIPILQKVADFMLVAIPIVKEKFTELCQNFMVYIDLLKPYWDMFVLALSDAWTTYGQPLFDKIMQVVQVLYDAWLTIWPSIQQTFKLVWDTIKIAWDNVGKPVFDFIYGIVMDLVDMFIEYMPMISDAFKSAVDLINLIWENVLKPVFDFVSSYVKDVIVPNWQSAWNSVKNIVDSVWNGIYNLIVRPFSSAVEFIKNGIDKIKGFFNFKIKWPHIPMPHFNIKGSLNPFDWFSEGVPKIGVEWYAKGGILKNPAVFGFNPYTNSAMVGGEKGPEAIAPISQLMDYIKVAVDESNNRNNEILSNILKLLSNYLPMQQNIVLDNGVLVGQLAPSIDEALGTIRKRGNR